MLNLLFIDDDAFVLSAYQRMLHNAAYQCQFVQQPEHIWLLPELANVDMVLVDQQMPGIRGSELLWQLQQRYPAIKRVLITGDVEAALQQLPAELVLDAVLAKPCSKATLIQSIAELGRSLQQ
ncbi:hypothetical protein WG68_02445 [Arsukibacterium ikkense]|uniref:Response regulatory domain-containing protein n=1 Tax=Arsukibacterium ikkense TaxID=336831 RepID=A0A0M2V8S6_9GAMM|nr:response regulator [Arsukibacterium ikkense]KKO46824.1 hypothetical protein WG68_02445 [Arsukibacterium ikkense]